MNQNDPISELFTRAPWLLEPGLGVCVVGSTALREACDRVEAEGPVTHDLDLSWALDIEAGEALLQKHRVHQKTTEPNRARGTLALKLGRMRVEITSFRRDQDLPGDADMRQRIEADLAGRDMTVGALAWWLAEDEILDPFGGLADWQDRRIVPVGDPAERIAEHPVRWLRYYRRAHQWGFRLDSSIRRVKADRGLLQEVPPEAIAGEIRAALDQCPSPGHFLCELHEAGLLAGVAPELERQFDGRPAGPIRHHPEISQALHLLLSLRWCAERAGDLSPVERNRVMVAVLCHDLGKGYTPKKRLPSHLGHEQAGLEPIGQLLNRLPGLTDQRGKRLAEAVCALHLIARDVANLRAGSRAKLYEQYFRDKQFEVELFALALGADSGGRLGREKDGELVRKQVLADIAWIRKRCEKVDAAELWERHKEDKERFKTELHQAWARQLQAR